MPIDLASSGTRGDRELALDVDRELQRLCPAELYIDRSCAISVVARKR